MHTKFKRVVTALAAGLITVGTVGLVSACGSKTEQAHQHAYVEHAAVSATCETAGYEAYFSCQGCDKYFDAAKKEINGVPTTPALGHKLKNIKTVPASITHDGYSNHAICEHDGCDKLFWNDSSSDPDNEVNPEELKIEAGLCGAWSVYDVKYHNENGEDYHVTYEEYYSGSVDSAAEARVKQYFSNEGLTFFDDGTILQRGVDGTWKWENDEQSAVKTTKNSKERTYKVLSDGRLECTWTENSTTCTVIIAKIGEAVRV